jgi:RNA polymerase sigma factor (sigma-70 family)
MKVDATPPKKKEWVLTPEAFQKLLAALDPDENRAAEQYEALRQRLVRFFEWRGIEYAEDQADETLNRVARKLDEGEEIKNVGGYAGGVARLVLLEALKEQEKRKAAYDELPTSELPDEVDHEDEIRLKCFETCLQELPADARKLILDYYDDDQGSKIERRKRMAEGLGLPMNALRNRALRIRNKLEGCITDCTGA